jgi:flavodoxin
MSDIIVLYATRGGHSRALARDLAASLGAVVLEIGDLVNRKGLFGWLKSGRQAAMRLATPITDPKVDLNSAKTIVLVQPVWASAICPPIRTWLRAHSKELCGKRLALLFSDYSTPAAVLLSAYESEFSADLGKPAACAMISQKLDEPARSKALGDFAAELKQN